MPEAALIAGILLVAGTVGGLAAVAYPPFLSIWTGTREHHLATVVAHPRAWLALNAGFALATISTVAALAILGAAELPAPRGSWMLGVAAAYALAGTGWLAVLAIRARLTPALGRMVADGRETEPVESLLGATTGGLYGLYTVGTGVALVALGVVVVAGGVVTPVAGWFALAWGLVVIAIQLRTGDVIAALPYLPTLLLGVALLAGWR